MLKLSGGIRLQFFPFKMKSGVSVNPCYLILSCWRLDFPPFVSVEYKFSEDCVQPLDHVIMSSMKVTTLSMCLKIIDVRWLRLVLLPLRPIKHLAHTN